MGVSEHDAAPALVVFPDPASTELRIPAADGKRMHARLYDMLGQLVLKQQVTGLLPVAGLAPGSYHLLITDGKGHIQGRTHFVKQ